MGYLSSAYGREGMNVDNQLKFHEELRESMSHSLYKFFIDAAHIGLYHSEYSSLKHKYGEPTTFVDFFGYTLGKALLTRKNIDKKLSDLQSYVKDGEVPYPIIVATSLKDGKPANEFYAYMENTPHAVSFPGYNIESEPQKCGSLWDQGFVLRESPELPLHFYMGCTGCAFSILLNSLIKNGGETSKHFLNFVESFREKELIRIEEARKKLKEEEDKEKAGDNTDGLMDFLLYPYKLWKDIRDYNILNHRNAVIERTGKMLNFVKNLGNLELHRLGQAEMKDVRQAEVAENLSTNFIGGTICTDNDVIDICDAGIVQNVCTNAVMDDRRTPDLVLVMDFNAYESDEEFDYMPLLLAWARSGIDGVRFPPVNSEALATKEPQELLIFESDGDDCPTVMWFTLCNKEFRKLRNYEPKSTQDPPDSRWFNDFPVFGEGTSFKTINFSNTPYQFDQLRELMYYNVSKNIDKIKDQIVKAIKRKTRRLANS
nr:cytosolic phospholipase A2 [Ciona intestinalis]|eukprot:XP_002125337.3 cytosolic phospholipase A2 [Ciona intestinalis]